MVRLFLFIIIGLSVVNSAERSMFEAGNLESNSPYGLTSAEKVIVKNKKIVTKNEKKIKKVDFLIDNLSERLDGFESLLEGDGEKLNKVYLNLNSHLKEFKNIQQTDLQAKESIKNSISQLESKLETDVSDLKLQIDKNNQNIQTLQKSFDEIVVLVNEINKKYVTKEEFKKLISILDKKEKKAKKKQPKAKRSNKQIMEEVRALFKKDYFTKAIPLIEYLIEKKYRPAECNYYYGEILYYRGKFKESLHYFKTSMMLYDKAKYLPKLLLHSAIAFEKTGDAENAENFYTTLIEVYPNTKEAKEASKKISENL